MKKYVPLISVGARGKLNSMMHTGENVNLVQVPEINSTYTLKYDADRGILYAIQPDGTVVETSGFNTKYTIGVGETGYKGNDGIDGADGIAGIDGADGIDGQRGAAGDIGYTGETGDRGAAGLKGITGETGRKGIDGDQGPIGKQGDTGDTGEKGFRGQDKNLVIMFSQYEPAYTLRPGSIWFKLVPRVYSGTQQDQCGSESLAVAEFLKNTPNSTRELKQKSSVKGTWKMLKITNIHQPIAEYLKDLFSTVSDTVLGSEVYDEYADFVYPQEESNLVWNDTTIAWCSFDPLIKYIQINIDTMEYELVEKSDTVIFFDRSNKCPGITLENLCLIK